MNQAYFKNLILELIDENPFAIRAVLKILQIDFTEKVPTLAVTREDQPRLLVNMDFINHHCRTDAEVKALICHEFLHILLRHTEKRGYLRPAEQVALDAVINAIIHRQMGAEYSAMMSRYYKDARYILRILRPMTEKEEEEFESSNQSLPIGNPLWMCAWNSLYRGGLVADDIKEIAEDCQLYKALIPVFTPSDLLGNHQDLGQPLPKALQEALDRGLRAMNGSGIWRSPGGRGVGGYDYQAVVSQRNIAMERWIHSTRSVLKKYILPDNSGRMREQANAEYHVPILSSGDRRAFIRALWSPFIPDSSWKTKHFQPSGLSQVYLDVSGSMDAEMPYIIALLNQLRQYIRMPFWAFSTTVSPAVIEKGQLKTRTTGGTSLSCVLEHIERTEPASAVIVTDGYIEAILPGEVPSIKSTRIHALVTRDGNSNQLAKAGISYSQLERLPDDKN